jgi:hypothetical protein
LSYKTTDPPCPYPSNPHHRRTSIIHSIPSSCSSLKSDNSYSNPPLPLSKQHLRLPLQLSPRTRTTRLLRRVGLGHGRDTSQRRSRYFTLCLLVALPSPSVFAWTTFAASGVSLKSQFSSACLYRPTTQSHGPQPAQLISSNASSKLHGNLRRRLTVHFPWCRRGTLSGKVLHTPQGQKPRIPGIHAARSS